MIIFSVQVCSVFVESPFLTLCTQMDFYTFVFLHNASTPSLYIHCPCTSTTVLMCTHTYIAVDFHSVKAVNFLFLCPAVTLFDLFYSFPGSFYFINYKVPRRLRSKSLVLCSKSRLRQGKFQNGILVPCRKDFIQVTIETSFLFYP